MPPRPMTMIPRPPAEPGAAPIRGLHRYWTQLLHTRLPGFPDDYTTFDLETSGFDAENDLILEVGLCMVRERRPVSVQLLVLDWTGHPEIDQTWLRERIRHTCARAAERGGRLASSYERLHAHPQAVPPVAALRLLQARLSAAAVEKEVLVGHNARSFDARFLKSHFRRWLAVDFAFGPGSLYDTGVLEKASQLGADGLMWAGETFEHYCARIVSRPVKGVRWSLNEHCTAKYGLLERYRRDNPGAPRPHEADFDALLCHYLFEELRSGAVVPGGAA